MKKIVDILMTICALLCGVAMLVLCSPSFMQSRYAVSVDIGSGRAMTAAVLSFLIVIFHIIGLFKGMRAKSRASADGNKLDQFIARQYYWVEDWCEHTVVRAKRNGYLSAVAITIVFIGLGFYQNVSLGEMLLFNLPMGLILGELVGVFVWFCQKGSGPSGMMKKIRKSLLKELPSDAAQADFAEDMLQTGEEWTFRERGKSQILCGVVGSRYWVSFSELGVAKVVYAQYVQKIQTEFISDSIRINGVRTTYHAYNVNFYYQDPKASGKTFTFNSQDGAGAFMILIRKRVGDSIEITAK